MLIRKVSRTSGETAGEEGGGRYVGIQMSANKIEFSKIFVMGDSAVC